MVAGLEVALRRLVREMVATIFAEEATRRRITHTVDMVSQVFEAAFQRAAPSSKDESPKAIGIVKSCNDEKGYGERGWRGCLPPPQEPRRARTPHLEPGRGGGLPRGRRGTRALRDPRQARAVEIAETVGTLKTAGERGDMIVVS
jgi:hypothetical protein